LDTGIADTNIEHFPVPILIPNDDDLGAYALPNGRDIVFTTAADTSVKLSHEIESYDEDNGALVVWVRVPLIPAKTDTRLFMYFGDPDSANQQDVEGTWPAPEYRGVWHLSDNPVGSAPQMQDSTVNDVGGAVGGNGAGPTSREDGIAGRALSFDGATPNGHNVIMDPMSSDHLDPMLGSFSVSLWLNLANPSSGARPLDKVLTGPLRGYQFSLDDTLLFGFVWGGAIMKTTFLGTVVEQEWTHVALVIDREEMRLSGYLNGVFSGDDKSITDLVTVDNNQPLALSPGGGAFGGSIDEVRIYGDALTDDWIKLEHHALTTPEFLGELGPIEPY